MRGVNNKGSFVMSLSNKLTFKLPASFLTYFNYRKPIDAQRSLILKSAMFL